MAGRFRALSLLRSVSAKTCQCPAHSSGSFLHSSPVSPDTDYAFEMACSNIRYGPGVTSEVGQDLVALGAKNVLVVTDKTVAQLQPMSKTLESLTKNAVNFSVFDDVMVEPTDKSFEAAIAHARAGNYDAFVAVGGGSAIDTCKVANLFAADRSAQLLDYVNAPIGKGKVVTAKLAPLIAIPTTSGTGSETTGVAIFDYLPLKAKTGIASRALRPLLGLVDPLHTLTMPRTVATYSGFDVLCHALESYTAIPYHQRSPRPKNPLDRPAYQGSNPISDVWARDSLKIISKYFKRSVGDAGDLEARSAMHLASAFAGVGFGNAGVHLCHGLSYAISGNNTKHVAEDYDSSHPLIPHGLSVVITAPAVFQFTAPMCPDRHKDAINLLGGDASTIKDDDAGVALADVIRRYMQDLGIEDGLSALGYSSSDVPALVEGTLPQHRVTKLAPRQQSWDDLAGILEDSMTVY
uniref:Probable hydroxyacid-oxoacid transhydrogenase, mitochondrial n=1 Tax=Hirondellea gigas TaxID=1518452 RepID=A0A2P2HVM9_9CRUS